MMPFRDITPKRRCLKRTVAKYSDYKPELKFDFNNRCGYCNSIDKWRNVWFEVDHFVPQKYLKKICEKDYSNLVYACRSCNNSKRAHWPSEDESIHNNSKEGFIDPCNDDYANQFERNSDGKITYRTTLGEWMFFKLKLHKPQHEIIWQIETIDKLIEECENLLKLSDDNPLLKDKILDLYRKYREYTKILSDA